MDINNIWELIKQNQYQQALEILQPALAENPEDSGARLCAFWCYYHLAKPELEKLKELSGNGARGAIHKQLEECARSLSAMMDYYEDGDRQRNAVGWYAAQFAWHAAKWESAPLVASAVKYYRRAIPEPTPEQYHSFLLRAVLEIDPPPNWLGMFMQYWNLANFQEEDYVGSEFTDSEGKKRRGRSLAAKTISTVSKYLSERLKEDGGWFDAAAPAILRKIRGDDWAAYHFAKYLLSRDRSQESLPYLSEALAATRGNAAVWSLLASVFDKMGKADAAFASAIEACSRDATVCGRGAYEIVARELEKRKFGAHAKTWQDFASVFASVWTAKTPEEQRAKQKEFSRSVYQALKDLSDGIAHVSWNEFEEVGAFEVGTAVVKTINESKKVIWVCREPQDQGGPLNASPAVRNAVMKSGPGTQLEVLMLKPSRQICAARLARKDGNGATG